VWDWATDPKSGKQFKQQFGHVGIIGSFDGNLYTSVDGGQGGRSAKKDFIKWVPRGAYDPLKFNGWCDIDIYFGATGARAVAGGASTPVRS
jgi:hypothetical protein